MNSSRFCAATGLGVAVALLLTPALPGQTFLREIPLLGLGNGESERPFGITHEPVENRLYVGLAGVFGSMNDVVVEIDPVTDAVVGTIQVGTFPEDVAFHYDPVTGQPSCGMVSNNDDGTVAVWDAATRTVIATVPLPSPFGGSSYPFGFAVDDARAVAYVSTVDGSGDVHAIDLETLQRDPVRSLNLGAKTGGRMLLDGDQLVVPSSEFLPGWTGTSLEAAGLAAGPAGTAWNVQMREETGVWASGQDVVQLPDGRIVLGGLDGGFRLYVLTSGGELLRTFRMSASSGAQGLALDAAGELLAVCDLAGNRLTLIDAVNWVELSVTDLPSTGQGYYAPNEAVFVGDKLYLTCQNNEAVLVFDQLPTITPGPGYAGSITVNDATPDPGAAVRVDVSGAPAEVVALFTAFDDRADAYQGVALEIGPNPRLDGWGTGSYSATFDVPPNPALAGLHAFAQGVVDATGTPRVTEPRVAIVQ